jgi:hypothetical protein
MSARSTAVLLVAGAVVVNAAFLGLVQVFDYPDVLNRPPSEVMATFAERQAPVSLLFLLLATGAGLLAPIALRLGRLGRSAVLRASIWVGVAAALVQVVGLLRWPLLVPGLAATPTDPEAIATFARLHLVLGTLVGETVGYTLTAVWTVLVAVGLRRSHLGPVLSAIGIGSAVMISTGVVEPLGVPLVGLVNFVGYVVWSAWLVALAVVMLRQPSSRPHHPALAPATVSA